MFHHVICEYYRHVSWHDSWQFPHSHITWHIIHILCGMCEAYVMLFMSCNSQNVSCNMSFTDCIIHALHSTLFTCCMPSARVMNYSLVACHVRESCHDSWNTSWNMWIRCHVICEWENSRILVTTPEYSWLLVNNLLCSMWMWIPVNTCDYSWLVNTREYYVMEQVNVNPRESSWLLVNTRDYSWLLLNTMSCNMWMWLLVNTREYSWHIPWHMSRLI